MTEVSVISTTYNEEDNLAGAEETVLSQTYDDFEWVIVDDGSNDRTPQMLSELEERESRVRVEIPDKKLGRAEALNRAVKLAEGMYIANQDIDDNSYPNRIERQVKFLDNRPNVGGIGSYYLRDDRIRGEKYIRKFPTEHREIVRALAKYVPIAHTLAMYRKSAWEDAGGYPKIDNGVEDHGLWVQMASSGWNLATVPEVLGEHVVYDESSFHSGFNYYSRQLTLARMQAKAISTLNLPRWMYGYCLARLGYPLLPTKLKRVLRRLVANFNEEDKDV